MNAQNGAKGDCSKSSFNFNSLRNQKLCEKQNEPYEGLQSYNYNTHQELSQRHADGCTEFRRDNCGKLGTGQEMEVLADNMKVAICTDGIFPEAIGGMQRHSRKLTEALSVMGGLSLSVLHPHDKKLFDEPNVTEYPLQGINPRKKYLSEVWKYSKRVAQCLDEIQPDIIYSQGLSVWKDIKKYQDRLIINPHGLEPYQGLTRRDRVSGYPFRRIFDSLFNRAAVVISLGGNLTPILRRRIHNPRTRIAEIPNAVDIPKFSPKFSPRTGDRNDQVLFAGRFASNKGITILMEAIARLNDRSAGKRFTFLLAGKGPLYETCIRKYHYDNVSFLGFVSDEQLAELYKTSDLFVLPTLFEGMPTVVLEAMAYGLPVIVTDVGATAELVDSNNGYLISKGSAEALEAALIDFSRQPDEQRMALGLASRKKVEEMFTWKKVAQLHYKLFEEVLHTKPEYQEEPLQKLP